MRKRCFLTLLSLSLSSNTFADGMFFGDSDIDWWGEGKKIPQISISRLKKPKNLTKEQETEYWIKAHDPRYPEFWDEKVPVRVAITNPSDDNIKNYIDWEQKRAGFFAKFHDKLNSFVNLQEFSKTEKNQNGFLDIPWNQVKIIYFYSSSCYACQQNAPDISMFEKFGTDISYVQVGGGNPLHRGSIPWEPGMAKDFKLAGTPTTYLRFRNQIRVLEGPKTFNEYTQIIRSIASEQQAH